MKYYPMIELKAETNIKTVFSPDSKIEKLALKSGSKSYYIRRGDDSNKSTTVIGITLNFKSEKDEINNHLRFLSSVDVNKLNSEYDEDDKSIKNVLCGLKKEIQELFDKTVFIYGINREVFKEAIFYFKNGPMKWRQLKHEIRHELIIKIDHFEKFKEVANIELNGINKYHKLAREAFTLETVSPNASIILICSSLEIVLNLFKEKFFPKFKSNLNLGVLINVFYEILLLHHSGLIAELPKIDLIKDGVNVRNDIVHHAYKASPAESKKIVKNLNNFCAAVANYSNSTNFKIITKIIQTSPPAVSSSDLQETESSHDPDAPPS